MRDWQALAERISRLYKPQPDSSVLHYDQDLGVILVNYIENAAPEEVAAYASDVLQWRVASVAGLLFLYHALPGHAWSDTPVNLFNDETAWGLFLETASTEIRLTYLLLDSSNGSLLTAREIRLEGVIVNQLKEGLHRQRELGLDALLEAERLGDPQSLLENLASSPELPEIVELQVDREKQIVKIAANFRAPQEPGEPRPRWMLRGATALRTTDFKYYEEKVSRLAGRKQEKAWRYCFYPVARLREHELEKQREALGYSLAQAGIEPRDREAYLSHTVASMVSEYSFVYMALMLGWRQGQGIYRFDPDLLKTVSVTALPHQYSTELLTRLPEFCVYIETPGTRTVEGLPLHGFFAAAESVLEVSAANEIIEERRMWMLLDVAESASGRPQQKMLTFSLDPPSIGEALKTLAEVTDKGHEPRPELERWLERLVVQLLYICSEEPEIRSLSGPRKAVEMPTPTKTRKGFKVFVPTAATVWECGWRTGALVRRARDVAEERSAIAPSERRSPRGHTRRAHFHLYWTGPRDLETREPRIKYLSMIRVNLPPEDVEAQPAVIHPVRS